MKQENIFTKCSLAIFIVSTLAIINNLFIHIQLFELHFFWQTLLIFIGSILSILGLIKQKTKLNIFLTISNVCLLFSFEIVVFALLSISLA